MSLVTGSFPGPFWFGAQADFTTRKDRHPSFSGWFSQKPTSLSSFARGSYNKNFDRLIANYKLLGETFDVPIIPVGAAMRALSKERKPDPAIRDGWLIQESVHGSAMGIALLHYAFASALTGKPATELRYEVVSKTKGWDKGRHYVVGEPDSRKNITTTREIDDGIKRVAWDFVREYNPDLVK